MSCFTLHCHVCIGISNPSHFPHDGDNAKVMPGYPLPCTRAGGGGCQVVTNDLCIACKPLCSTGKNFMMYLLVYDLRQWPISSSYQGGGGGGDYC